MNHSSSLQPNVYFVGIKGVALASLAELMADAGWKIRGSDVAEDFITAPILQRLKVQVDTFEAEIPNDTTLVVYTGAHNGPAHPQVVNALAKGIRCLSHAEALAEWANKKHCIAVCGVGGKSTISAMIAWVLEKTGQNPSFAVGVGDIIGLNRAGKWSDNGQHCVVEADEYATDPTAVKQGAQLVPRFKYFRPNLTVATHITFDHPDVYTDIHHTVATFTDWFLAAPPDNVLISHAENRQYLEEGLRGKKVLYYGVDTTADAVVSSVRVTPGVSRGVLEYGGQKYAITLAIPGSYNLENAAGAFLACVTLGLKPEEILTTLASFQSTSRRFEFKGTKEGALLYDDYAHHPTELQAVLTAAQAWAGERKVIVAFQPHTYSRTKALWSEFVTVLATTTQVYLLKIFASARETADDSITTEGLAQAITKVNPKTLITVCQTTQELAAAVQPHLQANTLFLTVGAGDIYTVHDLLKGETHDE